MDILGPRFINLSTVGDRVFDNKIVLERGVPKLLNVEIGRTAGMLWYRTKTVVDVK